MTSQPDDRRRFNYPVMRWQESLTIGNLRRTEFLGVPHVGFPSFFPFFLPLSLLLCHRRTVFAVPLAEAAMKPRQPKPFRHVDRYLLDSYVLD